MPKERQVVDPIGHRMKTRYEMPFRATLPQCTYMIVRVDGKAFHTYTKGSVRPYDSGVAEAMDAGALALAAEMKGCQFGYGQSDEFSFLATDFDTYQTEPWFKGNVQKIASVSASIFTAAFNFARMQQRPELRGDELKVLMSAAFDARVFVIPSRAEVANYFLWRQQDAEHNSLNMLASCYFTHAELLRASNSDRHEMLHCKGVNWSDCPADQKRGRVVCRKERTREVNYVHSRTQEAITEEVTETYWGMDLDIPVFNQDRSYLDRLIPVQK